MSCIIPNTLESQVLTKLAVILWNNNIELLERFHFRSMSCAQKREEWLPIEKKVLEDVYCFPVHDIITERIVSLIRPVGLQMYQWKVYLNGFTNDDELIKTTLTKILWDYNGTVNYTKTVESLVSDDAYDISLRYKLACTHCLESKINSLWAEIPKGVKKINFQLKNFRKPTLVQLWTALITGKQQKVDGYSNFSSVWSLGLNIALKQQESSAVKFFWSKLGEVEKKACWSVSVIEEVMRPRGIFSLCTFFRYSFVADIVCFLTSCVDEETRAFIKINFGFGLTYFLEWPHQKCFLNIAKYVVVGLSEFEFDNILSAIIHKMEDGFQDYDYSYLFRELWKLSPASYRSYAENVVTLPRLLPHLFNIGNKENISLVLRGVTQQQKCHIASLSCSRVICLLLADNSDWNLLKFFISEFLPTQRKLIQFRNRFSNTANKTPSKGATRVSLESKVYAFIDDLIWKCDQKDKPSEKTSQRYQLRSLKSCDKKRIVRDENYSSSKRLCTRYSLRSSKK